MYSNYLNYFRRKVIFHTKTKKSGHVKRITSHNNIPLSVTPRHDNLSPFKLHDFWLSAGYQPTYQPRWADNQRAENALSHMQNLGYCLNCSHDYVIMTNTSVTWHDVNKEIHQSRWHYTDKDIHSPMAWHWQRHPKTHMMLTETFRLLLHVIWTISQEFYDMILAESFGVLWHETDIDVQSPSTWYW